jgi:hypothetical protein
MQKSIALLLGAALWAASMFIKLGEIEVSGKIVPIYVGSAYHWILEIAREPTRTFTGVPVLMAFGLCLLIDLLHFALCIGWAWIAVWLCRRFFPPGARRFCAPRVSNRPMKSLPEIETEVNRLAAKIDASGYVLPTYGRTEDGARPHVEADARGYHYVVVERGQELRRDTTPDLDELLYHVFEAVTFSLANKYAGAHVLSGQDFRRLLFARQIELLASLSSSWAEREERNHQRILQQHPFSDQ